MSEYKKTMIEDMDLNEFRDSGMLWWVNQQLHLFGAAIAMDIDDNGNATNFRPVRCKFRGFPNEVADRGYANLTHYLDENSFKLMEDCKDTDCPPKPELFGEMRDMTNEENEAYENMIRGKSIKTGKNIFDMKEGN